MTAGPAQGWLLQLPFESVLSSRGGTDRGKRLQVDLVLEFLNNLPQGHEQRLDWQHCHLRPAGQLPLDPIVGPLWDMSSNFHNTVSGVQDCWEPMSTRSRRNQRGLMQLCCGGPLGMSS